MMITILCCSIMQLARAYKKERRFLCLQVTSLEEKWFLICSALALTKLFFTSDETVNFVLLHLFHCFITFSLPGECSCQVLLSAHLFLSLIPYDILTTFCSHLVLISRGYFSLLSLLTSIYSPLYSAQVHSLFSSAICCSSPWFKCR